MIGGKGLRELTAKEWPAVALITVLLIVNAWGIYVIGWRMCEIGALYFQGVDLVVGPVLIAMRAIRIFGLLMLLGNKKAGFGVFLGGGIAEFISYILFYTCDPILLVLVLKLMGLVPFEFVIWMILFLAFAPIALRNLLADCWESLK